MINTSNASSECLATDNGIYAEAKLNISSGVTMNGNNVNSGNTTNNSITLSGAIANPTMSLPSLGAVTFGSNNMTVNNNGALGPGSYKHVKVKENANITMAAGNYYIDHFDVQEKAKITLLGPVTIHAGRFHLEKKVEMNGPFCSNSAGNEANLRVKW
jgi:hypothetical protein